MKLEEKREMIKEIIHTANSQFVTVDFVKKDGTERTMNIQYAAMKNHLVGEDASESAKKAVETRKKNNPNLFPVYDVAKKEIRSINLDTVTRISYNGVETTFKV